MDDRIRMLAHTDEVTKVMLQKLIEKKSEYEKYKLNHLILMSITSICTFFFFLFVYLTVIKINSNSISQMFTDFISKSIHLYLMFILAGCFAFMRTFQQKRDEAEDEFHTLRCEIIDKSSDLWGDEKLWNNRHQDFKIMKEQFDINLYYESK